MSLTVHVMISVTKSGFVEMCRRQGWLEPYQQGTRMITCIDSQESLKVASRDHKYVPAQHALWFDDNTSKVGYDGDFAKLKQASQLFVAPECLPFIEQMSQLENDLRMAARRSAGDKAAQEIREKLLALQEQIYPSPLMLCCEGLADAKAAGRNAEIVIQDGQPLLDVEVTAGLQDVSMGQEVVMG